MTSHQLISLGQEPRKNYKKFMGSVVAYLCNDYLEADQFHDDDLNVSLGAGSVETALPLSIFQAEAIRRGRPAANIIQSSRNLPFIAGETVNDRRRRAEFHDKAIDRISACFGAAQDVAIIGEAIQEQLILDPPRNLAALLERITAAYGDADISVIDGIEASMQLPLNPAGSIDDDLRSMILLKNQLPPSHHVTWSDFKTIKHFHARLRNEEQVAVDVTMNVNHPDILLRTWEQYAVVCKQQVKLYRIAHPYTAIAAAAAKSEPDTPPSGPYCFGCNQDHDPTKCGILAAIISAHPHYKRVLRARQRKPMQIPVDGHTLLVSPGFALVFNVASRKTDTPQRPRSDQARGRGGRGNRGGRAQGRPANAAAASDDATPPPPADYYDADTATTMSDF